MGKTGRQRTGTVNGATVPLVVGAAGTVGGIVLSLTGPAPLGGVVSLAGLLLQLWGLHRLGRLGADPPAERRTT
jgi:hypothetical protein